MCVPVEDLKTVRLNVQLTKKCNQRCKSCNSYLLKADDEMDKDTIIKAIKQACSLFDIKNIAFTGGEPTLHKDILEIARTASQCSTNVSITTNGYYCTTKDRVKDLINAGINRFSFFYHVVGGQDGFTGVVGSENRIRQAIEWVCEERKNNPNLYVKIATLFDGSNIENVSNVLDYAEHMFNGEDSDGCEVYIELLDEQLPIFAKSELDKHDFKYNRTVIENNLKIIKSWKESQRSILLDDPGYRFMKLYFTDREKIAGSCPLGKTDLYIESNGDVRTGCWALPPIGNIKKMDLEDIIKSTNYESNIQKMLRRQCNGCTCGYLMQAKYMHV